MLYAGLWEPLSSFVERVESRIAKFFVKSSQNNIAWVLRKFLLKIKDYG